MGWRRILTRGGGGLAAASLVLGLVAFAVRDTQPSADEQLESVRAFLADASTGRFTTTIDWSLGQPGELGQSFQMKMQGKGEMIMPARSHYVLDYSQGKVELIVTGDGIYERSAESGDPLREERWTYTADEDAGGEDTGLGAFDGLLGSFGQSATAMGVLHPEELRRVVDHLREPERVGDGVIRATMALADVLDPADVEDVEGTLTVELTSSDGGRLDRTRWTLSARATEEPDPDDDDYADYFEDVELDFDVVFSGWGDDLTVETPDQDEVDEAEDWDDGIEVHELEEYRDAALVGPRDLPTGWRLTDAYVEPAAYDDDDNPIVQGDGCDNDVYLMYTDPKAYEEWLDDETDEVEMPSDITVYLSAARCEHESLADAVPYRAGTVSGHISRQAPSDPDDVIPGDTVLAVDLQFVVGDTFVELTSDLPQEDLDKAVASFASLPLDEVRRLADEAE